MNKWFDGYNNEPVVVLDDIGIDHKFMGYELKKLADRYCYMVEIKNGSMYIRPEKCVVTSQYRIQDIWADDTETQAALMRRFVQVELKEGDIELAFAVANERLSTKNNMVTTRSTPSIPNEKVLEVNEITADEFDSVMEKYNAKPVATKVIEKLPKKLQPRNKFFPDRPIRFAPYNKKFNTPRLVRKNAIIIEEKKPEIEEILSSEEEAEVELTKSSPEEISSEEVTSDEDWHDGHGASLEDYLDMYCQDEKMQESSNSETPSCEVDDSE